MFVVSHIPRGVTTKNAQRKLGVFCGDLTMDKRPEGSMMEGESGMKILE